MILVVMCVDNSLVIMDAVEDFEWLKKKLK